MRILFIDLASKDAVMAITDEKAVLGRVFIKDHKDEGVMVMLLDELLKSSKTLKEELTHIACVLGPGGFTTLRVGVSFANALSHLLKIPAAGLHISDLLAASSLEKDFVWIHSTRKTQLFVRGFGKFSKTWPESTLLELDDLLKAIPEKTPWIGDLLDEHKTLLGLPPVKTSNSAALLPSFLVKQSFGSGKPLLPWYGRGI